MSKPYRYVILAVMLAATSCSENADQQKFVPTDVIIKTKADFKIDQVFEFINEFDHDVESIYGGVYNAEFPSDSLEYVLNKINAKSYTNDEQFRTGGYLHYQTNRITIFPRLFDMKSISNQNDWLETMDELMLTERTDNEVIGYVIHFHVPAGEEKEWVAKFKTFEFVEWAEVNAIAEIVLN